VRKKSFNATGSIICCSFLQAFFYPSASGIGLATRKLNHFKAALEEARSGRNAHDDFLP
jgi:hypothetical protein